MKKGAIFSQEHRAKLSNARKGKRSPKRGYKKGLDLICLNCGISFYQPPCDKAKFCSYRCAMQIRVGVSRSEEIGIKISDTKLKYSKHKFERLERRKALLVKPENCEVCGISGKDLKMGLAYDHDHATGKFRGWLCARCNVALGMVKDNTETLIALVKYLNKVR